MDTLCRYHPDVPLIEDFRSGDQICSECGLIVGGRAIDAGSEWRTFGSDRCGDNPSRVGARENPLLCGADLGTAILGSESSGEHENCEAKHGTPRAVDSGDRALRKGFRKISAMAVEISLPKAIVDRSNILFKDVHESNLLKPRSKDAVASACLYIACREGSIPRTFKEICTLSRISKKEIGRCFKLILKTLGTSVDAITTQDFMSRFCSNLHLPPQVQEAASEIARNAEHMDLLPGRSPVCVTAAAIYMASQASEVKRSQREVSKVAGVSEATIRQAYKVMYPNAEDLFPEHFNFFTPIEELPLS